MASLTLEVSIDGGTTWRMARTSPPVAQPFSIDVSPDAGGRMTTIAWDSVKDLGFHQPRAALLRFSPSDAQGAGPAVQITTPAIDNLRVAARAVDHYLLNYGGWDDTALQVAQQHQLGDPEPEAD